MQHSHAKFDDLSCIGFTVRHYASAVYAVIVCLSVSHTVTCRYCTKTATSQIMQT